MPKFPRISGDHAVRTMERLGFVRIRQKGSHLIMKRNTADGIRGCVIPMHKELATGTLHSILRQAHISPEEFLENL